MGNGNFSFLLQIPNSKAIASQATKNSWRRDAIAYHPLESIKNVKLQHEI
ncbi:hypothetical protein H6G04_20320 [Calothrix membranacea FACHB-236]|nr:hypothetical protein [Calothrix membranacea FACHB-236]